MQLAALLSEAGALAVLSALSETDQTPDAETYFLLCRNYGKALGNVLLQKWSVNSEIISVFKQSGCWQHTTGDKIGMIDITNLAVYYTALFAKEGLVLPALESLAAYGKLPEQHRRCVRTNWLALVVENKAEIPGILSSFK